MLRVFLSAALVCGLAANGGAAAPLFETTPVFRLTPKKKPNYRIPALLLAGDGSLLAVVEKRNGGPGDIGNHDIVLKLSRDQGLTWSEEQVVLDNKNRTSTDHTVARDAVRDHLWIFFLREKKQFAYMRSDDWVPAIQYLGTKGFFADYDARPTAPLSRELAQLWGEGLATLRSGKHDGNALARRIAGAGAAGQDVSSADFAALTGLAEKELPQGTALVTRGAAALAIYRSLIILR